ncbi:VOC family protein [Brevundimonas sp. BT-123]|uniref:VOC family protein n=1 Tax=Brevundimonas sp. BT-123 TaxID=2986928 RepID=UPI0022368EB7|nr:VOC family protein [Brevundimonas sp. BT-123]MCW0047679.1 VOC family protein [Brevundimonas sp. BT-123]
MTDRMSLLAIGGVAAAAFLTWTTPTLAQEARPSAELAGHALHQVAMTTSDLARATVFYRDVLGLPFQFEANGMAFFDVAGIRLMLAVDPSRTEAPPTSILYFDAPDFAETHRRLVATGVALEGPVETVQRTAAGELRIQQFRDPDGNMLAIMGIGPSE